MLTISYLKNTFFNGTMVLKIIAGVTILAIGSVIIYNQMLSIAEKKTMSNYNLLQGCIDETPHDQEEEKCFKKYPIDVRFVDLTVVDSEIHIIQKYYASVDQQPKNSWIREQIDSDLNLFGGLFAFLAVLVLIAVIGFKTSWLKSRSHARKEDMTRDQEEEDDCQCDDCVKRRDKN